MSVRQSADRRAQVALGRRRLHPHWGIAGVQKLTAAADLEILQRYRALDRKPVLYSQLDDIPTLQDQGWNQGLPQVLRNATIPL